MDFGRAFVYVFRDTDWVKKVLIGGLLLLIPFIGWFIAYGYGLAIINRVRSGTDLPLPEWDDLTGYLSRGFVLFVGTFIWLLPFTILSACANIGNTVTDGSTATLFSIANLCLILPLQMIYSFTVIPMVMGQYATKGTFESMFQFNEVFSALQRAGSALLMLILLGIAASIVGTVGLGACFIGIIFTAFFASLVFAHGIGQVYGLATGGGIAEEQPAF